MRYDVGRFRRPMRRGAMEQLVSLISLGDGSTLTLDFTTGVLDSRLTFTRASTTATYINSSGYVTTAGTNVPRFDYDPTTLAPRGLLIEAAATNLLCWSESFATSGGTTNWTYNGNSGATVTETNPAGGSSSFQFRENSGSGPLSQTVTTVSTSPYTYSFWVRASVFNSVTTTQIQVGIFTTAFQTVSISKISGPGSVSGTGLCTVSGLSLTEWTKVQVTTTGNIGVTSASVMLYAQTASFELDRSLLIWGAQFEAGSGASSYIPTGASQATRNADYCVLPTSSFITGTPYPNTLFVDCIPATANTGFPNLVRLFDRTAGGTFGYGNEIYYYTAATMSVNRKVSASTNSDRTMVTGFAYNTRHKFATAIDSTSFIGSRDGVTDSGATTAPAALSSVSTHLGIGCNGDSSPANVMNGWMRQLKFWPTALPQATLNSITTL